ncbi:MAG: acetoin utilization protein AcuC [Candidatus Lokiarchaeota archaeon]
MNNKVGLVHTNEFQKYNFGPNHPLRPLRLELTYSLMEKLGLLSNQKLVRLEPHFCSKEDLKMVHDEKYIEVVEKLSKNPEDKSLSPQLYGLGPGDNPIFEGMFEASSLVCGASIVAAETVWNNDDFNITFNPAGGLHHAMKDRASGFCIFNDIAVAIKRLQKLKKDIKIAYLDIDCHHGDGVQWIFYEDPNVLTISLHENGKFLFPGTGDVSEIGKNSGEGYAINFPLIPGTSTKMYLKLFTTCIPKILKTFEPDILITQLGVDTHFNDPLTQLGLSIKAYKQLAEKIKSYAKDYCKNKWFAVGGGGYLMSVVPRAWTLFLAQMLDVELENKLPDVWIREVKKKASYEETPYTLWDRGDKIEVQLLSHPEVAKKMSDYTNSLIKHCDTFYLPRLTKK